MSLSKLKLTKLLIFCFPEATWKPSQAQHDFPTFSGGASASWRWSSRSYGSCPRRAGFRAGFPSISVWQLEKITTFHLKDCTASCESSMFFALYMVNMRMKTGDFTLSCGCTVVYIVRQNCKYIRTHQLGTCWCCWHYLRWFVQVRCLIWKWQTAGECTRTSGTFQRESLLDRDLPLRLLSALAVSFWKLTDDRITMGPKPYPMHESL